MSNNFITYYPLLITYKFMKDWIKAARLRTLPLSLSGIIMGAFIAKWRLYGEGGIWDWKIFALAF
jgi:1,4-dihydroxy-2-naphthoate octaprenyltransferase